MNASDAHSPEYAAAAAGMSDTYGGCTYAVGDRVTYRLAGDGTGYRTGRVAGHKADGTLYVEADGRGPADGIDLIDARLWPAGNVLPF